VVVAEELGEVVQENKKDSKSAAVQAVHWLGQLGVPEEWAEELEESREELSVHWPTLLLWRQAENAANEDSMRDNLQPGVSKPGSHLGWAENGEHVAVGG